VALAIPKQSLRAGLLQTRFQEELYGYGKQRMVERLQNRDVRLGLPELAAQDEVITRMHWALLPEALAHAPGQPSETPSAL